MKKVFAFCLVICLTLGFVTFAAANDEGNLKDITTQLTLEGAAVLDKNTNTILLCPKKTWSNGKAKCPFEITEDFTLSFDYKIGGGTSADGIMVAFFAEENSIVKDGGYLNFEGCGGYGLEFDTYPNTNDSKNAHIAIVRDKVSNHLVMVDEPRVDDEKWHNAVLKVDGNRVTVTIDNETVIYKTINFDKAYRYMYFAASTGASTDDHYIRNVKLNGRAAYSNSSQWAEPEMDKAEIYNLIPAVLKGEDMAKKITRAEFAALSVRLYEEITGKKALAVPTKFTDTDDEEIAKAFGLGIAMGVSETKFEPFTEIPREQVASMLARTMNKCNPSLEIKSTGTKKFSDDEFISGWARESVYFMAERNIISGIGNNMFVPNSGISDEDARQFASSTREQSLAIAVRVYENMK